MPPRRNRIPNEVRRRIVRAFEDPTEDYLSVTDTLGANRSTARSIVATYLREGRVNERPRGGRNNVRVDNEMRDCINEILNENCLLTLQQINEELRRRLPAKPLVCDRTIGKTMDGMLISVKMARAVPAARNRPDVIEQRYEYANWFMTQGVINDCIFIDECGYNIWTARSYGRARVGERAYRQVSGQRGRNVTICLAVSPTNGLVYHTARIGGMNRQLFNDFLGEVGRRVNPDNQTFLVFDNAPAHRNADCPRGRIEIKMLPPYSPFLNIVEQAISALKAALKAEISRPDIQATIDDRDEARRQGIPLGEYRQRILLEASQRNMNTITAAKCAGWYRFMQTYVPRCLNREHIEG